MSTIDLSKSIDFYHGATQIQGIREVWFKGELLWKHKPIYATVPMFRLGPHNVTAGAMITLDWQNIASPGDLGYLMLDPVTASSVPVMTMTLAHKTFSYTVPANTPAGSTYSAYLGVGGGLTTPNPSRDSKISTITVVA